MAGWLTVRIVEEEGGTAYPLPGALLRSLSLDLIIVPARDENHPSDYVLFLNTASVMDDVEQSAEFAQFRSEVESYCRELGVRVRVETVIFISHGEIAPAATRLVPTQPDSGVEIETESSQHQRRDEIRAEYEGLRRMMDFVRRNQPRGVSDGRAIEVARHVARSGQTQRVAQDAAVLEAAVREGLERPKNLDNNIEKLAAILERWNLCAKTLEQEVENLSRERTRRIRVINEGILVWQFYKMYAGAIREISAKPDAGVDRECIRFLRHLGSDFNTDGLIQLRDEIVSKVVENEVESKKNLERVINELVLCERRIREVNEEIAAVARRSKDWAREKAKNELEIISKMPYVEKFEVSVSPPQLVVFYGNAHIRWGGNDFEIGKYILKIDLDQTGSGDTKLRLRHAELPEHVSQQHPHVNGSYVCWGNIRKGITSLYAEFSLAMLVTVVWKFLNSYTYGDSFIKIENFVEKLNEMRGR